MKEPVKVFVLERHVIKFYDETDYSFDTVDNTATYEKTYISGSKSNLTSLIGIELFENNVFRTSCLVGSEGGGTGITENSTLISYGGLVVCCSNTVFKLTIPDLNLEWKTVADSATCFGIFHLNEDYVVHGELEITRLDKNGKIIWQKTGRDIWTTLKGTNDFEVHENVIVATDWQYNRYKIDFEGNFLDTDIDAFPKDSPVVDTMKIKKWWKF